jgi:hypothetical protein
MSFPGLLIRLAALAAIALHLAAGHFPEEAAWGIWPYTALPAPLGWLGALAVAALVLPPVNDALGRWLGRLWASLPGRVHFHGWAAALAVAAAIPFWLFRIRHLRWGDADFIVKALSYTGPDRPIWTIYNWQAPLSIFTHAQLWFLLNPWPGVGVDTLYALSSVLSGVGFVYVLFLLADLLGRDLLEKATIFGLVATTGSMQLFFGYVENYTIISLGLLLTLYLGVRCLRGEISLAWPSLALAVTNAFHPSTIVMWPAVCYAGWVAIRRAAGDKVGQVTEAARLVLPPILVLAALSALMASAGHGPLALLTDDRPGGADAVWFVPLFETTTKWQHYTMFSLGHFLDWGNEHFLISPFGLALLLLALVDGRGIWPKASARPESTSAGALLERGEVPEQSRQGDEEGSKGLVPFLAAASVLYLLLTFVWNPDYGGRKDWDLFAPSAFVYTLLAAYLLVRQVRDRLELARCARLLIAVSALFTAAWIYYNTIPWPLK